MTSQNIFDVSISTKRDNNYGKSKSKNNVFSFMNIHKHERINGMEQQEEEVVDDDEYVEGESKDKTVK